MYNNNGNSLVAYNNYKYMPQVPYKIIERIATNTSNNAENLWKILKYATTDAISKTNLTYQEKLDMIWSPDKVNASQENLFSVFLKPLVPSALNEAEEQIQLRIWRYMTKPTTRIESAIAYQFDMITQENCSMVYDEDGYLVERTDLMEYYLLDLLNGSDIEVGSSFFAFDTQTLSNGIINSTLSINNGKSLYGRSLRLALKYVNVGSGGVCQ
jgi:hypothetical protein